jgi:signal transduction histidine kinase
MFELIKQLMTGDPTETGRMLETVFALPGEISVRQATLLSLQMMNEVSPEQTFPRLGQGIAEYLYDHLRESKTGEPCMWSVRVHLLTRWDDLSDLRQDHYRSLDNSPDPIRPNTMVAVLLGTCGQIQEICQVGSMGEAQCVRLEQAGMAVTRIHRDLERLRDGGTHHLHRDSLRPELDQVLTVTLLDADEVDDDRVWMDLPGDRDLNQSPSVIAFGVQFLSGRQIVVDLHPTVPISSESIGAFRVLALAVYLVCLSADGNIGRSGGGWFRSCEPIGKSASHDEFSQKSIETLVSASCREVERSGERLNSEADAMRSLMNRLILTDDAQRRELARDLHDEVASKVGSIVFVMQMILDDTSLAGAPFIKDIQNCRNELIHLSDWARLKSHELHPAILSELGCIEALTRISTDWGRRTRIAMKIDVEGNLIQIADQIVASTVCVVVQECLRNIEKHAAASEVLLTVGVQEGGLVIRVNDNGVGFAQDMVRSKMPGIGLIGMAERLRVIGVRLRLTSQLGCGTCVESWVPLEGVTSQ